MLHKTKIFGPQFELFIIYRVTIRAVCIEDLEMNSFGLVRSVVW
jgi:hypothetical protein